MGYAFRLTARVLLYAPSHRQDNTYHGLCYTSRGALAGTRNITNDESGNNNGNDGRTTVNENKPYVKECILLQCNDLFNGQIKYYLKIYIFDLSLYFRNIFIYVTTMSHLLTINNWIMATHHKIIGGGGTTAIYIWKISSPKTHECLLFKKFLLLLPKNPKIKKKWLGGLV